MDPLFFNGYSPFQEDVFIVKKRDFESDPETR
jgi:hypothetical protein